MPRAKNTEAAILSYFESAPIGDAVMLLKLAKDRVTKRQRALREDFANLQVTGEEIQRQLRKMGPPAAERPQVSGNLAHLAE